MNNTQRRTRPISRHDLRCVGEIYISNGNIVGDYEAEALSNGQLVAALRRVADLIECRDDSASYFCLDEGKLSAG